MDSRVVTSAYDDDVIGNLGSRDVTSAYDDDAIGHLGSKDVTSAYDDSVGKEDIEDVDYDDY